MKLGANRYSHYHSYLLRLWREGTQTPWRVSLQSTENERIYHFVSIDALFAFLEQRVIEDGEGLVVDPPVD